MLAGNVQRSVSGVAQVKFAGCSALLSCLGDVHPRPTQIPGPVTKKYSFQIHAHSVWNAVAFTTGLFTKNPPILQNAIAQIVDANIPLRAVVHIKFLRHRRKRQSIRLRQLLRQQKSQFIRRQPVQRLDNPFPVFT